jgi:hypothetical protein
MTPAISAAKAPTPNRFRYNYIPTKAVFLIGREVLIDREVVILSGAKDPCISPLSLLLISSIPTAKPL